jgi:phospholipid-translocating ATPase
VVSLYAEDDDSANLSDPLATFKAKTVYRLFPVHEIWLGRRLARTLSQIKRFHEAFRKHVFRIGEVPPSKDGRRITLDARRREPLIDQRTGKHYVNNTIRSSRYSLWSFFPRQLVAQFSKLANFYFLVVSILQMIPGLSTTGTFTTFVPLMVFVGISMAKEGFDDLRRYRLDKEENNRDAYVLRPVQADSESPQPPKPTDSVSTNARHWSTIKWVDIQVGDVIKLERDKAAPADLVLLHADGPDGIAYIETMALDGETNLKSKQPCLPVAKACATTDDIVRNTSIHFAVEDPNIDLYKFDGNVTVGEEKVPLTNNEVVYRGSVLRNTREAVGIAVYTGEECKIRMNATKNPRIKAPALQNMVNRVVAVIVLFVVILASACTIAYHFWSRDVENKSWYLQHAKVSYGPIFTSFLIMYNTMIPISLYVSLEIIKVAQMLLLNDIDMYDEASNTPLEARTSTINEELGQVRFVPMLDSSVMGHAT